MVSFTRKEKKAAGDRLHCAVKVGKISKPDNCSQCGDNVRQIDGHHRDYSKPLEVEWLCTKCHSLNHRLSHITEQNITDNRTDLTKDIDWGEHLEQLSYREREIIKLRYGINDGYTYTLEEVGRIFKVTRERVRQIEKKALHRLKKQIET